ncbi:MAG: ribonuclease Z [Candidatus Lokiarchaeota archaeon]|nr:ribonuclease Z [Candidatus Lokiarchaeota archaeon]
MELIILGSSAAIPVRERNLSATALKYKSELLFFDCGEDIQRKLVEAGLKFNKPLKILISHFHGDHVIGLPGLLFRFGLNHRTAPVTIYGPVNLFLYLFVHRKVLGLKPNYPITVIEIDDKQNQLIIYEGLDSELPTKKLSMKENTIFDGRKYLLKYALVDHSVLAFAYSFIEKPRSGKFNPEKAKELGIPESYIWKKLQEGEIVDYKGKLIDPIKENIVGPKRLGRKVTYTGDTVPCENLIELGRNSDILVHEATFSKELSDIALEKKHSTATDAAVDAKKMNAKQLILTHISSRYQEDDIKLLEEAKEIFPNSLLAKDLMRVELK